MNTGESAERAYIVAWWLKKMGLDVRGWSDDQLRGAAQVIEAAQKKGYCFL